MAKKQDCAIYMIAILLAAIAIIFGLLMFFLTRPLATEVRTEERIQAKWYPPDGFSKIDSIRVEGSSVLIIKDCKAIIAQTTPERALGIFNALNNKTGERPDIYEGMASVLQTFGIKLEAVLVHRFEKDTFFADSYFRVGNSILQLDMKPSDAMATAFRTGAPIYYNMTLFNEMGQKVC